MEQLDGSSASESVRMIVPRRLRTAFGLTVVWGIALPVAACRSSKPAVHQSLVRSAAPGVTHIDATDTAAYADAGLDAVAAVANCRAPKCRPDIFSGPGPGELTVGLDSGTADEFQWHLAPDASPPGGQAFQDSSWHAMLAHWESSKPAPLLLVDGVPRTYAYAREHVSLASVSGMRQVSPAEAKTLSSDTAAAHGAIVIATKGHSAPR
jgi:hypothetical protein